MSGAAERDAEDRRFYLRWLETGEVRDWCPVRAVFGAVDINEPAVQRRVAEWLSAAARQYGQQGLTLAQSEARGSARQGPLPPAKVPALRAAVAAMLATACGGRP